MASKARPAMRSERADPLSSASDRRRTDRASSTAPVGCYSRSGENEGGWFMANEQLAHFLRPGETLSSMVLSPAHISANECLDARFLNVVLDAKTADGLLKQFSFFDQPHLPPYAFTAWTNQRVIWLARHRDGVRFEAVDKNPPVEGATCRNELG